MSNYIQELRELVGNKKVILVAASALIFDNENRLLLQRRSDNGYWGIPGGYMEVGETVEQTARREVFEETGLTLGRMELFGVYSGPDQEATLPNGHELANVKFVFCCRDYTGEPQINDHESKEIRYFPLDQLPESWFPAQRLTLQDLLSGEQPPFIR